MMKLSEILGKRRVVVDGLEIKIFPKSASDDNTEYIDIETITTLTLKALRERERVYNAIKPECGNLDDNEIKLDVWKGRFKTSYGIDFAIIYAPRCWR